jgi:alanine dehydrogenase
VVNLANKGWKQALQDDTHLANGLNVTQGKLTCAPVAKAQHLISISIDEALKLPTQVAA